MLPRALTELPLLSEALAKGELGYSKVRALTRIAAPGNEADLLNIGLHGTAQHVEMFVRLHRRAKRAEETERADAQARESWSHLLARGRWHRSAARAVSARDWCSHPERVEAGWWRTRGAAGRRVGRRRVGAEGRPTWDVWTRHIPRRWGHQRPVLRNRSLRTRGKTPRCSSRRPTWDVQPWTVAHRAPRRCAGVDGRAGCSNRAMPRRLHRTVTKSWSTSRPRCSPTAGRGRCEIEHRTAMAAETARRLCCDAGIVPVVDDPTASR